MLAFELPSPIPSTSSKTGQGVDVQTEPATYSVPGFAWVRRFTLSILVVSILLVSGVVTLITFAEMDVTVSGTGQVEPRKRARIKTRMEGRVRSVHVKSGEQIGEGQVVCELDDTAVKAQIEMVEQDLKANQLRQEEFLYRRERDLSLFEAERAQAAARVETASLQLEQVSREYRLFYEHSPTFKQRKRQPVETLLPIRIRRAVIKQSSAELDAVTRKIESMRDGKLELKRLKTEEKKLRQDRFLLRHRLDAMKIRSDVQGTVLTREVDQLVGDQVKKGDAVLEVAELGAWQVKTSVREIDFPKVKIGQSVRVYLNAFPYTEFKVFRGRVAQIPGRTDQSKGSNTNTYPVLVSIQQGEVTDGERAYSLSYGMKATTKIVIERGSLFRVLWRSLLRSVGRLGRPEIRVAGQGAVR
jgi:multidrug resistance efflux pump